MAGMSPVAKRRGRAHTGRAVLVAIVGVAVALGTAFGVATLASRGDVEVRLGDDRFNAGSAEDRLARIQADGAPIGFGDPATFDRPIWVDNLGDDPEEGWFTVLGVLPTDPGCGVQWSRDDEVYVADCDGSTFPRSGEGLRYLPTSVTDDGDLVIDLFDGDDVAPDDADVEGSGDDGAGG